MAILKLYKDNASEYCYSFEPPASFKELVGGDMISSLKMPCGGRGVCGKCRVLFEGNALPPDESEKALLGAELSRGIRLGCRLVLTGDAKITLFSEKKSEVLVESEGEMPALSLAPIFGGVGAAVDIGTTTIAARLYDLKDGSLLASFGVLNPQGVFGADVISRIEKALSGSLESLHRLVIDGIYSAVCGCFEKAGRDISELSLIVAAGNTAMSYLAANKSPASISRAPFESDCLFGDYFESDYFKSKFESARFYLLPCISAYIGGDVTAAMIATDIDNAAYPNLLVDIGTNGETVVFDGERYFAASAAAGPAFEGAGLSCGVNAVEGAISSVFAANGKLYAKTLGNAAAIGICGSGVIELLAALIEIGEMDETGYLENDVLIDNVTFTSADVRSVQLAKGAIYGSISAILRASGLSSGDLKSAFIAGGFGTKISLKKAEEIKMLPNGIAAVARAVGNASLEGASRFMLFEEYREKAATLSKKVKTLSLASDPIFTEEYMNGMMF